MSVQDALVFSGQLLCGRQRGWHREDRHPGLTKNGLRRRPKNAALRAPQTLRSHHNQIGGALRSLLENLLRGVPNVDGDADGFFA